MKSPDSIASDISFVKHFSLYGRKPGSFWHALNDPKNNTILLASLEGFSIENFDYKIGKDARCQLDELCKVGLVRNKAGFYSFAFDSIIGEKRTHLYELAGQASKMLMPTVSAIMDQIAAQGIYQPERMFHILWSIIMDGDPAWENARTHAARNLNVPNLEISNRCWFLYPIHSGIAGTNSYTFHSGNELKVTWYADTPSPNRIHQLIVNNEDMLLSATPKEYPPDDLAELQALGIVDSHGASRLMLLNTADRSVFDKLGQEFSHQLLSNVDLGDASDFLGTPSEVTLLILYHEICYEILQHLHKNNGLSRPAAYDAKNDVVDLLSVSLT